MKINKPKLVGAIIGGVYAFIPSLLVIQHFLIHGTGGDPGSAYFFIIPLFWPAGITWFFPGYILSLISPFSGYVLGSIVNIVIWIFIGLFIGEIFKRKKENKVSDSVLIKKLGLLGALVGLLVFTPAIYFFDFISVSGLIQNLILIGSVILISAIIGALIGFLINKTKNGDK